MRWNTAARLTRQQLYRVCCCPHRDAVRHTGKAGLLSTTTRKPSVEEEVSSTLYVPGNKAASVDSLVTPYLDFSKQFQDVPLLQQSISLRGLDVDLMKIVEKWSEWKELEEYRLSLEEKRKTLTKTLNALKNNPKNKERISELKEHGKKIRNEVKVVTQRIWDLEEIAVIGALNLPNNLHNSTDRNDKLLLSVSKKPVLSFHPKSHIDLGAKSEELEIIDNSPTAYYLKNKLALLELVCNEFFSNTLSGQGFSMMSNSDFVKGVIMEGCGVHVRDRGQLNRLSTGGEHDTNSLHLVGGGSLQAFAAFFTKHIIEKSDQLPIKAVATGRHYSAVNGVHPGLLGCRQSSVVDGFVLYEDVHEQERALVHEALVMLIGNYLQLGVHFQVVQYGARRLYRHEGAAVGILMFSPHTGQYHEVGRISLCGDYISKRLWTLYKKDKYASFVSMLHIRACHTAHLLALLMENCQKENGTYTIPECLHSAINTF